MNVVVSSPLDALVFDHAIFGVFTLVNNFWAWVAVITAALSYWRIRASSSGGVSVVTVKSKDCIEWPSSDTCPSSSPSEPSLPSVLASAPPAPSTDAKPSCFGDDRVMITKGKFAVYYYEENDSSHERESDGDCDGDCDGECDSDGAVTVTVTVGGEWWGSWERGMRMRTGDDAGGIGGWYRYQDLTVINGNIVRLWDGVKGEMYSSSCCVVW